MAQLKEGSVIKKSTGDEIIATINDLDGVGGGSIVDLGTFNNETELITHAVMNQLPSGYYTFMMSDFPSFMLLKKLSDRYIGTLQDNTAQFLYFEVSFYGEMIDYKTIDLRGSVVGLGTFNNLPDVITHAVMNQLPTGHYTFVIEEGTDTYTHFMLLTQWQGGYMGTLYDNLANVRYFSVSFSGEIDEFTTINLRDLGGVGDSDLSHKADITYVDSQDALKADLADLALKADKTYVDNQDLKQMPISGGVLENYREKLTTVSASGGNIDLSLGNVFVHTPSGNRTYSITNAVNGQAHSFTLIINMGSTVRTLTFPASVKWQGGEIPDMSTANKTYVLTFMSVDGGTNWLGIFGGEF